MCAALYRCSAAVIGVDIGVSRYGFDGYPASPSKYPRPNSPDSKRAQSRLWAKIVASCADPYHRDTTLLNFRSDDETAWTFSEKYPFLFLKSSASSPPGDCTGTCVQSMAPIIPGNWAMSWKPRMTGLLRTRTGTANDICGEPGDGLRHPSDHNAAGCLADAVQVPYIHLHVYTHAHYNLPDNLPDKASPGETGSASRVTQTEIVYKVTHLYNVFPIAAWSSLMTMHWLFSHQVYSKRWSLFQWKNVASIQYALYFYSVSTDGLSSGCVSIIQKTSVDQLKKSHE